MFIYPDVLFPRAETEQLPGGGRRGRDCERGPRGDAAEERGVSATSAKHRSSAGRRQTKVCNYSKMCALGMFTFYKPDLYV